MDEDYASDAKESDRYMGDLKNTRSINEFADELEINTSTLGCVMLDLNSINIWSNDQMAALLDPSELYVSENPEHFWIKGDVTDDLHVTLLYGLLTPAYEQGKNIDTVMRGWERPKLLRAGQIDLFPSPYDDENYMAVVAKVHDDALDDAHARLSYLPHVDTNPKYKPHVTLFYVKANAAEYWKEVLNRFPFTFEVSQSWLNLGSAK